MNIEIPPGARLHQQKEHFRDLHSRSEFMHHPLLHSLTLPLLLLLCLLELPVGTDPSSGDHTDPFHNEDSLIMQGYIMQVLDLYVPVEELTAQQLDSVLQEERIMVVEAQITYSSDSTLSIYVVEVEGCGAYCNSEWYAWIHHTSTEGMVRTEASLGIIQTIHVLGEKEYLVISRTHSRPASVLTIQCLNADVISISNGNINAPTEEAGQIIGFCQENGVELEEAPQLTFDAANSTLNYLYGNNYSYSHGLDVDTIHKGSIRYENGSFELVEDVVTVNDRRR